MVQPRLHEDSAGLARRARVSLAVCAGLIAVVVAGCSGNGTTASTSPPTTSRSATSTTPSHPTHTGRPTTASQPSDTPATEFSPPGDIPDNQVFVRYTPPGHLVSIKVPEGWARSRSASGEVTFTDKLNSVTIVVVDLPRPPTPTYARNHEVPQLRSSVRTFALGDVTTTMRSAGKAVLVTYQKDSEPDPVTGKVVRDAVERYDFWKNGHEAILSLSGPVGADNVDPWRIVSDSLTWK